MGLMAPRASTTALGEENLSSSTKAPLCFGLGIIFGFVFPYCVKKNNLVAQRAAGGGSAAVLGVRMLGVEQGVS